MGEDDVKEEQRIDVIHYFFDHVVSPPPSSWSIPKNRGGRQSNPLILAEDELLMSGRDKEYRRKCNQ